MTKFAIDSLPGFIAKNGWVTETAAPDWCGDVRVTAARDDWTMRLVFDKTGYMQGGYLYGPAGDTWHTTRRTDVKKWAAWEK